jgi:uncharacterized membrane protein YgdD (TMEM256/DUF423 family)
MNTISKLFLITGSINAFLAVVLGAFAAHYLKNRLTPDMLSVFNTGVHYHGYHALGIILIGIIALWFPGSIYLKWAGAIMLVGIILFSGSLYALSISGIRVLGVITPVGGLAFLASWVLLVFAVAKAA